MDPSSTREGGFFAHLEPVGEQDFAGQGHRAAWGQLGLLPCTAAWGQLGLAGAALVSYGEIASIHAAMLLGPQILPVMRFVSMCEETPIQAHNAKQAINWSPQAIDIKINPAARMQQQDKT